MVSARRRRDCDRSVAAARPVQSRRRRRLSPHGASASSRAIRRRARGSHRRDRATSPRRRRAERDAILRLRRRANMALYATRPDRRRRRATRRDLIAFGAAFGLRRDRGSSLGRAPTASCASRSSIRADGSATSPTPTGRSTGTPTAITISMGRDRCHSARCCCIAGARPREAGSTGCSIPRSPISACATRIPRFVEALMRPDAMAIPGKRRGRRTGPAGKCRPGVLRRSALGRARHALHRAQAQRRLARRRVTHARSQALLERVLDADPLVVETRLAAGEGLICNNVLHDRSGVLAGGDGRGRLLYRVRYADRVGRREAYSATGTEDAHGASQRAA